MGGASPALSLKAMAEAQNLKKVSFGIEGIVEPFVLKRGIKLLGPERFIFGSDFPISHPRIYLTMIDLICSEQEKKLIAKIKPGDKFRAEVVRVEPFGLFVRIKVEKKPLEGLVHISEVSWEKVED